MHTGQPNAHSGLFAGGMDVTTTDGVTKRFSDGDVLLVEDTTGDISSCTGTMLYLTLTLTLSPLQPP